MLPLAVVGNVNVDLIMGPVTPWPEVGIEVVVDHDELRSGGSAANSALTWAALGLEFQIAANTGSDLYGQFLRDDVMPPAKSWPVSDAASAISVGITHPNGERTFISSKGHLADLSWPQVRAMLDWERLQGGWLLVCGSFLTDALTAAYDALFDHAHRHGIRVAIDTGWPPDGWTDANRKRALHWAGRSNCLLVNEVEAASLTGNDQVEVAARKLCKLVGGAGIVVVKCGSGGALAIQEQGEMLRVAAPAVHVSDTIGAGDVFNAAFLFALARCDTLFDAVDLGVRTASLAISTRPRRYTFA